MKNSKKILILTSEFPPQPGGIGNHAYHLAFQLQQKGYQITVIADIRSKDGNEERVFDAALPFKVYRATRRKIILFTYLRRIWIYKKLAGKQSIIIASGKFPLWLVGLDPFLSKEKKYVVIHGSEVNLQGFYKKLTDIALQGFNQIVAVSNFTKSLVHNLKLKNIHVIPNGFMKPYIKPEKAIKKSQRNSFPILITVGNVTERKGQLNVIKALPQLLKSYPDVQYHIVGIPTEQPVFEKSASELKVLNCITFHGNVSEEKKQQLLHESDIFVMLSNSTATGDVEGFGIAILEANALGLPAIGSMHSGISDAIKEGESGRLVPSKDMDAFVKAIKEIWVDYDRYQVQAVAWSKQFNWSIIIKKYMAILNT